MGDESGDECFEQLQQEALHLLERNCVNYELRVEQRKAIRQLLEGKDLPAVLLTGYKESLIFQRPVLVGCERSQEARNLACLLVETPQTTIVNEEIAQVEAMDLSACNLAGRLCRFEDVADGTIRYDVTIHQWKV